MPRKRRSSSIGRRAGLHQSCRLYQHHYAPAYAYTHNLFGIHIPFLPACGLALSRKPLAQVFQLRGALERCRHAFGDCRRFSFCQPMLALGVAFCLPSIVPVVSSLPLSCFSNFSRDSNLPPSAFGLFTAYWCLLSCMYGLRIPGLLTFSASRPLVTRPFKIKSFRVDVVR